MPNPTCSSPPPNGWKLRSKRPSSWEIASGTRWPRRDAGRSGSGFSAVGTGQKNFASPVPRVYEDPADLLLHIDEVGGRR